MVTRQKKRKRVIWKTWMQDTKLWSSGEDYISISATQKTTSSTMRCEPSFDCSRSRKLLLLPTCILNRYRCLRFLTNKAAHETARTKFQVLFPGNQSFSQISSIGRHGCSSPPSGFHRASRKVRFRSAYQEGGDGSPYSEGASTRTSTLQGANSRSSAFL